MPLLLLKTSSLGDVIHNLPVVGDLLAHRPGLAIDWCVEAAFAPIVRLHPGVRRVIPVALRRWRKALCAASTRREMLAFRRDLQIESYEAILDTQGLLKSALMARMARGPACGYDAQSAREPLAARLYNTVFPISPRLHAVERNRRLAAAALGCDADRPLDYGIAAPPLEAPWAPPPPYAVFFTAASRAEKLWDEASWVRVGAALAERGIPALLPGGKPEERQRAARLAAAIPGAVAAPSLELPALAALIAGARGVIGVDTGLTHLAAALKVPTLALYTATDPGLTGVLGTAFYRNLGGKGQTLSADTVLAAWPA